MYKDIITYQLASGVTEEHLFDIAGQIVKEWMSKQAGFIKWEIHKNKDNNYTDIVYWRSQDDAQEAEADMVNIPNAERWLSCYAEGTISSKKLDKIAEFK